MVSQKKEYTGCTELTAVLYSYSIFFNTGVQYCALLLNPKFRIRNCHFESKNARPDDTPAWRGATKSYQNIECPGMPPVPSCSSRSPPRSLLSYRLSLWRLSRKNAFGAGAAAPLWAGQAARPYTQVS